MAAIAERISLVRRALTLLRACASHRPLLPIVGLPEGALRCAVGSAVAARGLADWGERFWGEWGECEGRLVVEVGVVVCMSGCVYA